MVGPTIHILLKRQTYLRLRRLKWLKRNQSFDGAVAMLIRTKKNYDKRKRLNRRHAKSV